MNRARFYSPSPPSQELPQHASSQWIASRAADHACQTSTISGIHEKSKPGERSHPSTSEISDSTAATTTHPDRDNRAEGTPAAGREMPMKGSRNDTVGGIPRKAADYDGDGCITLAITTCKRVRGFLGTVQGLQVRS